MGQLGYASRCRSLRFFVYAAVFIYLLFSHSEDNRFSGSNAKHETGVLHSLAENKKQNEKKAIIDSPTSLDKTSPLIALKNVDSYPDVYANKALFIKGEIKQLLKNRKTFYAESRTLSASEILDLHNVKDNGDYPFAITNEAQLILRELAIEHRIPYECSEEVTAKCLVILERSQAGSMPTECLDPQNEEECEGAFTRFWES